MFNGDKIVINLLPDHYISPEEALLVQYIIFQTFYLCRIFSMNI